MLTETYWNSRGTFQADYDRLAKKLIPSCGEADTTHGELLRCVTNIYYDLYNNGLCNIDVRWDEWNLIQHYGNVIQDFFPNGRLHFGRVNKAVTRHHEKIRGSMCVSKNFPYVSMEKVIDAVIQIVSKADMAALVNVS